MTASILRDFDFVGLCAFDQAHQKAPRTDTQCPRVPDCENAVGDDNEQFRGERQMLHRFLRVVGQGARNVRYS